MDYKNYDGVCGFVVTKYVSRKEFPDDKGTLCDMKGGLKVPLYYRECSFLCCDLPVTAVKKKVYHKINGVDYRDRETEKIIQKGFPYNFNTYTTINLLDVLLKPEQKFFTVYLYDDFIVTCTLFVEKLVKDVSMYNMHDHVELRRTARVLDMYSKIKYQLYHGVGNFVKRGERTVWDTPTPEQVTTDDDIFLMDEKI